MTATCTDSGKDYCSTALLTAGPDQTYAYLACASAASTQHLLVQFTTPTASRSSSSSSPATMITTTVVLALPSSSATSNPVATMSPSSSSTQPPTSTIAAETPNNPGDRTSTVVGSVVGALALVCFVLIGLIILHRYRRHYFSNRSHAHGLPWQAGHNSQPLNAGRNTSMENIKFDPNRVMPVELPNELQDLPVELSGDTQSRRQ
ncbi:hypothetical protein MMC09_003568 [Bachmanniomyces sp. S44760]|nr:hypothetical protein [Bachmanniomyces sp. S44760]